jgi:hypothetical protein
MRPTIRVAASTEPTREDNIDSARRNRASLLSKALWDAGARPGDPIPESSWSIAETALGMNHTSDQTRGYASELLKCRAEGREPLLVAGRAYDLSEKYHQAALFVDQTIRNFMSTHPHLDVEQAAVMLAVVVCKLGKAYSPHGSADPLDMRTPGTPATADPERRCR